MPAALDRLRSAATDGQAIMAGGGNQIVEMDAAGAQLGSTIEFNGTVEAVTWTGPNYAVLTHEEATNVEPEQLTLWQMDKTGTLGQPIALQRGFGILAFGFAYLTPGTDHFLVTWCTTPSSDCRYSVRRSADYGELAVGTLAELFNGNSTFGGILVRPVWAGSSYALVYDQGAPGSVAIRRVDAMGMAGPETPIPNAVITILSVPTTNIADMRLLATDGNDVGILFVESSQAGAAVRVWTPSPGGLSTLLTLQDTGAYGADSGRS